MCILRRKRSPWIFPLESAMHIGRRMGFACTMGRVLQAMRRVRCIVLPDTHFQGNGATTRLFLGRFARIRWTGHILRSMGVIAVFCPVNVHPIHVHPIHFHIAEISTYPHRIYRYRFSPEMQCLGQVAPFPAQDQDGRCIRVQWQENYREARSMPHG